MESDKLTEIKERLLQAVPESCREDINWLVSRIVALEEENATLKSDIDWLKKELSYADYQGEVGY
ncbi:MAG: hypothetical protein JRJ12_07275 [Deltaproteobacteria bacterium]|nr:hypothetical protein [Deltaproteobacteria bacterium]MBW2071231.1 hypothetical protein [Deltaproteobacteria bacterium]